MRAALIMVLAGLALAGPAEVRAEDAGQTVVSPDELRALAIRSMATGNPAAAAWMAEALLERDPGDASAMILRSEAAILLGDMAGARVHARAAWAASDVEATRFASARLNAMAHAQDGHYTRSQYWLRRARQIAPNEATAAAVAEDYRYLREINPLQFRMDLSISPTDNINNGTTNDTITLPGLPFVLELSEASQPLSGTATSVSGSLSYRLRETPGSVTRLDLGASLRTYALSPEAQARVPEASGSDFSEAQLLIGVSQFWRPGGRGEPWRLNLAHARFWYGGDPYSDTTRASVSRGLRIGAKDRLDFGLQVERVQGIETADSDAVSVTAGWTREIAGLGALDLSLRGRTVEAEGRDRAYDSLGATLGWTFAEIGSSVSYGIEERDYEDSLYVAGTRTDRRHTVRVSIPVPGMEIYGFEPVFNIEHSLQESNAARFETETTGAGFTFRSAF